MERIRNLGAYQKIILAVLVIMALVFSVIYPLTISKEGFLYNDSILEFSEKDGIISYSGKIKGTSAAFTVYPDKTATFSYGDKTYGPYILKEDSTAIPKENSLGFAENEMTGIELRCGDEIIFRGGMSEFSSPRILIDENGRHHIDITIVPSYDTYGFDKNGDPIDPVEPSVSDIIDVFYGPELTHKGNAIVWFCGIALCIITALIVLFADELFRWNIRFRVRNAENAEPADWEIASRYITWTLMTIFTAVIFIIGLH